jgi:hypothetical protein
MEEKWLSNENGPYYKKGFNAKLDRKKHQEFTDISNSIMK